MVGLLLKEAQLWFSVFTCDLLSTTSTSLKLISKEDIRGDITSIGIKLLGHFALKKLVFSSNEAVEY